MSALNHLPHQEQVALFKRFLEHAPPADSMPLCGAFAWRCEGVLVCKVCASRIVRRGCSLGKNSEPIFQGSARCELCDTEYSA